MKTQTAIRTASPFLHNPVQTGQPLQSGGVFFMEKPKLIQDLGLRFPSDTSSRTSRYGLYECPYCHIFFESIVNNIASGGTSSCGCFKKKYVSEQRRSGALQPGYIHGFRHTPIYHVWLSLKQRCTNSKKKSYKDYGGRGITVCDEWKNSFIVFKDWALSHGYSEDLEIDRINTNGNYEPSNCKFSNLLEQMQNTRLLRKTNTSGYRGVSRRDNRWFSQIRSCYHTYCLGYYPTPELAAQAYNDFVIKNKTHHPLNIIHGVIQPTE